MCACAISKGQSFMFIRLAPLAMFQPITTCSCPEYHILKSSMLVVYTLLYSRVYSMVEVTDVQADIQEAFYTDRGIGTGCYIYTLAGCNTILTSHGFVIFPWYALISTSAGTVIFYLGPVPNKMIVQ